MTSIHVDQAAARRKTRVLVDRTGLSVPSISSPPIDRGEQFTVGGEFVHKRTHRCVAFCNAVAALAGIGPVEVR